MWKRWIRSGRDLVLVLLFGLVAVQFWFVLSGGPQSIIPVSRLDADVALQGHEPGAPRQVAGNAPQPAPGQPEPPKPAQVGADPAAGGPSAGGIPVAFGENAPVNLPDRAGLPKVPDARLPGAGGPGSPSRPPGAPPPHGADPYRRTLLALYALEKQGGKYALTPAQARHFLALVKRMEGIKEAVPGAQKLVLETLTPEQMEFLRAQCAVAAASGQRFAPDDLDRYSQDALDRMDKGDS